LGVAVRTEKKKAVAIAEAVAKIHGEVVQKPFGYLVNGGKIYPTKKAFGSLCVRRKVYVIYKVHSGLPDG
jgi:ligand-binding sensor protein